MASGTHVTESVTEGVAEGVEEGASESASEGAGWPPGPPDPVDPAVMRKDPLGFVTQMHRTYGDISSHEVLGQRVLLLHHPALVRRVLTDNGSAYTKAGTPDDAMLRPLLGNGLLTSNGAQWEALRRTHAPAFRPALVAGFDTAITDVTATFVRSWQACAERGETVRMDHELTSLTLAVLVRVIQGTDVGAMGNGFGEAVDAVNRFIGELDAASFRTPEGRERALAYRRATALLDSVCRVLIAARRSRGDEGPDLLGHLLRSGELTSDDDLRDQVLTLIMAGHETTAKTLTWALLLLDRHPRIARAVEAEVDAVLAGRAPQAADLPRLALCSQVVCETMRLYPPVWIITRRSVEPDRLGGYAIPAGTTVSIPTWVLHHDERFHPDPEAFRPERFAPGAPGPAPYSYLPFGGGSRICIGRHLALLEATLVLAQLVSALRVRVAPGADVTPQALVTLRPEGGLPVRLERR